jgi:hypothetical protein
MATPSSTQLPSPLHTRSLFLRRQLALHYPVRGCLLLFRASLHRRLRVWVRRITNFELSLRRSLQRSSPTQSFQDPRPLRLLLQAQGRVRLHLLHLGFPILQLGQVWPTTLMRTTLLVSPFGLQRPSLPRRQILPLHLSRIRFLFGAQCQRGR